MNTNHITFYTDYKIGLIKAFRNFSSVGLLEAKNAVELGVIVKGSELESFIKFFNSVIDIFKQANSGCVIPTYRIVNYNPSHVPVKFDVMKGNSD